MIPPPPKWAKNFLRWYCNPALLEDLEGDLIELYQIRFEEGKVKSARYLFIWWVLRSFRLSALKKPFFLKNRRLMITTNNFKIAFRVLRRDKFNSLINIASLTIGIACFLLVGLYVNQELNYDQFHSKKDRIYRSWLREDYGNGKVFFNSYTPLRFEELFESNFPEVERSVQYIMSRFLVGRGEDRIDEQVANISPDFFEVFDFKLIIGNMFTSKYDLLISDRYSKKYFGDIDPIGQTLGLQINDEIRDFKVVGIFKSMPKSSSIQFDLAISTENNEDLYGDRAMTAWFTIVGETYVLIKDGTDITSINDKMQDVVMSLLGDEVNRDEYNIGFQPLTNIHLNPDIPLGIAPVSNPQYVIILGVIGILVLLIALVNYTTLTVAQSVKRSREVGMRKVIGAGKWTLISQYISESILIAMGSMVVGTIISILLIPTFNNLTNADISYVFQWWHVLAYLTIGIVIGIVAGIYPSFILSAFKTISVLRGANSLGTNHLTRKGMVIMQFVVAIFLISSTMIMNRQLKYLQNKDLGYRYDAVISVLLHPDPQADRMSTRMSTAMENGELLKARLDQYPEISKIAMGSHVFGTSGWANLAYTESDGTFRRFRFLTVDPYYLDAFDIRMKEGRGFEPGNGFDERQAIVINEAAMSYFGFEDPIGSKLPGEEFGDHQIIGVTENFNFSSLHTEVEPLIITQNIFPVIQGVSDGDFVDSVIPKLVFTYQGDQLSKVVDILKKEWESTFPNESIQFSFIDENIKSQYESEDRLNKLVTVSTVLSIIIACLGLLGLTVLIVNSRIKEIGIRKVMGAGTITIYKLLTKSFSYQLIIAIVISIPLTIWLMNNWLENFAYRVNIGYGVFLLSGSISILIALMVVAYHAYRASSVNPIETLRTE